MIVTLAVVAFGPYSDAAAITAMISGITIVTATVAWLFRRYRQRWRARTA